MSDIKNVSVQATPVAADDREMVLHKLSVAAAEALRGLDEDVHKTAGAGFDYGSLIASDQD